MNAVALEAPSERVSVAVSLIVMALGLVSAAGLWLPVAAKGPFGVTVRYLAELGYASPLAVIPMGLFAVGPLVILIGLFALTGRLRTMTPWLFALGSVGLLLSAHGVLEGIDHIRAFENSCMPLRGAADLDAPIGLGVGGTMQLVAYGGLLLLVFGRR